MRAPVRDQRNTPRPPPSVSCSFPSSSPLSPSAARHASSRADQPCSHCRIRLIRRDRVPAITVARQRACDRRRCPARSTSPPKRVIPVMQDSLRSRRNIRRDRHTPRRAQYPPACRSRRSWPPSRGLNGRPGLPPMPRTVHGDGLRASRSEPRLLVPTMLHPFSRTARRAAANMLGGNVCNGPHCAAVTCALVPAASR